MNVLFQRGSCWAYFLFPTGIWPGTVWLCYLTLYLTPLEPSSLTLYSTKKIIAIKLFALRFYNSQKNQTPIRRDPQWKMQIPSMAQVHVDLTQYPTTKSPSKKAPLGTQIPSMAQLNVDPTQYWHMSVQKCQLGFHQKQLDGPIALIQYWKKNIGVSTIFLSPILQLLDNPKAHQRETQWKMQNTTHGLAERGPDPILTNISPDMPRWGPLEEIRCGIRSNQMWAQSLGLTPFSTQNPIEFSDTLLPCTNP